MAKSEIYISVDVETTGPIPGPYSMLQLGAVAYTHAGIELGSFSATLTELKGAGWNRDTMEWWMKLPPVALFRARSGPEDPAKVMWNFTQWINSMCLEDGKPGSRRPIFVGYPASFDFNFVYWYLNTFVGTEECPFSFSALDIKTMAYTLLGADKFSECVKERMPKEWTKGLPPHTHDALDDAREQGELFFRIREEARKSMEAKSAKLPEIWKEPNVMDAERIRLALGAELPDPNAQLNPCIGVPVPRP